MVNKLKLIKNFFIMITFIFLFGISNVSAKTTFKIGNTSVGTFNYISVPSGWTYFDWQDDKVYSIDTFPDYFMITLCTDAAPIVSWVNNRYNSQGGTDQLSLESVTIFNTNAQCKFPDSTYSGAHIVYVIGKQLPERGTSTINWLINSGVTFYNNATASYSLLDIVFSQDPISYDLNTNTLITQNQDIINQNQTIINQNQATNDKLDNIDNTITDTNVDNPNFQEFEQYIADNGVITQLITLPVRLYTQILNNVNTTCTPFNLGEMFGHNLVMECINPSSFFGTALWNTIDILGTGLFIFAISKKMIAVFQQFTNLEEGDILD